jgi:hypothetical protein
MNRLTMPLGILGLPLYYYLRNFCRKRSTLIGEV